MKLRGLCVIVMMLALLGIPSALRAAEMKVGVVNMQDVIDNIEDGKKAKNQLKKSIDDRKKGLDDKQKEYKKLEEAYDKQKLILSPTALEEKRKELENKRNDLQRLVMTAQADTQKQEMELMDGITKKVKAVIEKLGRDGSYSMIMEKNIGGLIYNKDSFDMTKQVIDEYNKAYKK
jgi:outer membrane protein